MSEPDQTGTRGSGRVGDRRTLAGFAVGAVLGMFWTCGWAEARIGGGLGMRDLLAGIAAYELEPLVRMLGIILCATAGGLVAGSLAALITRLALFWTGSDFRVK